jgi:adenylate cyclase
LLSSVPAISVGVGVAVAGFAGGGDQGLGGLISIVGISLVVALTFSLAFTLLLADSVVLPIRRLETATARVGSGDLGIRVPVSSADETGTLTRAFNRMVAGLQERERLREAFGTFVDPGLADRVARDGTDVRGEELEVSILFMDVRGFTSYSESAPAREVVARLNELYEVVVPVITGHGGHANKFIGDGLLAVFGAPERHADHADRAVAAGLEIAERVGKAFHGALRVGLGINSGTVVVGTIGGGGRLDFTVIGDTVNTAARVESATRQTGDDVLITEATRSRLGSTQAAWGERPAIPLKGKSEEIRLFAPVDGTTLPSPTE